MTISRKDIKLLWGRSANRCAICRIELSHESSAANVVPVGEQAHIVAKELDGPRGSSSLSEAERDSYYNLILLCPTHHALIDKDVDEYPIEKLHIIKSRHELWVAHTLTCAVDAPQYHDKSVDEQVLIEFVKEWRDFVGFFFVFHTKVSGHLDSDISFSLSLEDLAELSKEWHARVKRLRRLLFLLGEDSLILGKVHDWDELRESDEYILKRAYKTPFSYMIDFTSPVYAVNRHNRSLWIANQISMRYLEYLAFANEKIRSIVE